MQTIAYRLVRDDLMLFMAGNEPPTESEWADYVRLLTEACERLRPIRKPLRFICFVDESPPNAKQRAAVVETLGDLPSRTAVVTTSVLSRNLITVFSWLGLTVKGFSPTNLRGVADYLDLPPAYFEQAMDAARVASPDLGGVSSFEAAERARTGPPDRRP